MTMNTEFLQKLGIHSRDRKIVLEKLEEKESDLTDDRDVAEMQGDDERAEEIEALLEQLRLVREELLQEEEEPDEETAPEKVSEKESEWEPEWKFEGEFEEEPEKESETEAPKECRTEETLPADAEGCVSEFVDDVLKRLGRHDITVEPDGRKRLKMLAQKALGQGDIAEKEPEKNDRFAEKVAGNLEFRLILTGDGNSHTVSDGTVKAVFEQLYPVAAPESEKAADEQSGEEFYGEDAGESAASSDVFEMLEQEAEEAGISFDEEAWAVLRQFAPSVVNPTNTEKYGNPEGIIAHMVELLQFRTYFKNSNGVMNRDDVYQVLAQMDGSARGAGAEESFQNQTYLGDEEPESEETAPSQPEHRQEAPEQTAPKQPKEARPPQTQPSSPNGDSEVPDLFSIFFPEFKNVAQRSENPESELTEALFAYGYYPTRKNDAGEQIPDGNAIHAAAGALKGSWRVLYACYCNAAYVEKSHVKKKKNQQVALSVFKMDRQIVAVTNKVLLLFRMFGSQADQRIIQQERVVSVEGVRMKSSLCLGQVQIELDNGDYVVVEIERDKDGDAEIGLYGSDENQYERVLGGMRQLLGREAAQSRDSTQTDANTEGIRNLEFIRSFAERQKSNKETYHSYVTNPRFDKMHPMTREDKAAVLGLLECGIGICNLISKELVAEAEKIQGGGKTGLKGDLAIFMISNSLINKRLNALMGSRHFVEWDLRRLKALTELWLPNDEYSMKMENFTALNRKKSAKLDELEAKWRQEDRK